MPDVTLTIDDNSVTVAAGTTILKAAERLGRQVPTICYHDHCTANGLCRICVVEVDGVKPLLPACLSRVSEGMKVSTSSARAERSRRTILEMLASAVDLSQAPEIQKLLDENHADPARFPQAKRREHAVLDDNPMYIRDYSKCILCWRCVQVCADDAQYTYAINFTGRGFETSIGTFFDKPMPDTTCVFCGQCVGVCPTGALKSKRESLLEQGFSLDEILQATRGGKKAPEEIAMITADRTVPTTCPYCGVGCSLELHIKDDYIYKVTSPFDSVVNRGNLCVKGRFGYDFVYNKDRVTTPLMRKTAQAPGERTQAFDRDQWREVSWDEALDYSADRLCAIYRRDGADAMAVYCCAKATNEDNYLLQKMYRALFRSNNVDHCTRLCHAGSVVALQMALGSSAMSNTAAEVIHSDVFLVTGSNTAETHPIIALQMKAAVEKHGAKLIVVDPRRVEMVNWAALWLPEKPGTDVPLFSAMAHVIIKERLYNQDFIDRRTEGFDDFAQSMEKFTPEYAEAISGVDRNLIVEAARMYATAKNAAIYWALGIPEHSHGTDNAMSLIHLALLTGHIGRQGTGLNPLRGQNNVQGASDSGAMPWHYPGYQRVDDEVAAGKFEQAWHIEPGALNRNPGLTTTEIMNAVGPGGVRALHIMGENPMMSEPNLNHTRHMIEQLEFLLAQDLFINESCAYADVFLPAASWAEKEGTFTNTDRRVQRVRKALEPRGQSRADWQIVCDLAGRIEKRLGRSQSAFWAYQQPSEVLAEMGRVVPEYTGVKYPRIEKEGIQTPVWDDNHPGTPFLFADRFPRGKGKFHPLEYIPSVEMPDDEYPFILTTGRLLEHWHGGTLTRHSKLDELNPEARIEINPADAARIKVEDGQAVRVSSRRGTIVLRAWVTQRTTVGVVFIPMHFAEAAANLLTIDALDPLAKIPEYKACAVRIVPAGKEELARPEAKVGRGRY